MYDFGLFPSLCRMKLHLRLSRIEEECAKLRKPPRIKHAQRHARAPVTSLAQTNPIIERGDCGIHGHHANRGDCGVAEPRVVRLLHEIGPSNKEGNSIVFEAPGCGKGETQPCPRKSSLFPKRETHSSPIPTENTN